MIVKIRLPQTDDSNKTRLTDRISIGATTLSVENGNGYISGQYVVIGNPGDENSEAVAVSASTDSTITVGATKYGHSSGDRVAHSVFDKYSIEYRTTVASAWTVFGSMPTSLRWDQLENLYRPSAALTVYSVRIRLYSTELTAYSNYSDVILSTGLDRTTVKKMTDQILKKMKDDTIDRVYILQLLNEAQDIILAENKKWPFLLVEDPTTIETVDGTTEYDLPDNYDRMDSVYYNYVDSGTDTDIEYELDYLTDREFRYREQDNNAAASDKLTYYTITADGELKVHEPEDGEMAVILNYYKKASDLDSDGDVTDIPLPSALKYYVLSILENDRGDEKKSLTYFRLYKKTLGNLTTREKPPVKASRRFKYNPRDRFGTAGKRIVTQEDRENYW